MGVLKTAQPSHFSALGICCSIYTLTKKSPKTTKIIPLAHLIEIPPKKSTKTHYTHSNPTPTNHPTNQPQNRSNTLKKQTLLTDKQKYDKILIKK